MPFTDPEIPEPENRTINNVTLLASLGLFVISLFNVAFCTTQLCRTSVEALLMGWFAMLINAAGLTWLANPVLIIAWVLIYKNKRSSWLLSLLASIISISFIGFNSITENEAGGTTEIIQLKTGYWLWVSSCITCFIGSVILRFRSPVD